MPGTASIPQPFGSLVFDCEVDEGLRTRHGSEPSDPVGTVEPAPMSRERLQHEVEKLKFFAAPSSTYVARLLRDVRYYSRDDADVVLLASGLSSVGYAVTVRTALGGGGNSCFRNLRHEFLTVRGSGDYEGVEFIVEPKLREAFMIPQPTHAYAEILAAAPDVFVGTSARLIPIVQLLCAAMADSFERRALTLPPWRRMQSMLSKWLPVRARDTCFSPAGPSFSRASAPLPLDNTHALPEHIPGTTATAAPVTFARNSDPADAGAAGSDEDTHALQRRSPAMATPRQHRRALRREDSGYAASSFVPFGGRMDGSDAEGPSPPAPGVEAARPALQHAHAAAWPVAGRRTAAGSSLLASRLTAGAAPAAAAAVRIQAPLHWEQPTQHRVKWSGGPAVQKLQGQPHAQAVSSTPPSSASRDRDAACG